MTVPKCEAPQEGVEFGEQPRNRLKMFATEIWPKRPRETDSQGERQNRQALNFSHPRTVTTAAAAAGVDAGREGVRFQGRGEHANQDAAR